MDRVAVTGQQSEAVVSELLGLTLLRVKRSRPSRVREHSCESLARKVLRTGRPHFSRWRHQTFQPYITS